MTKSKLSPRERRWMEDAAADLSVDRDERYAKQFMNARIGVVFRYSSPVREWGDPGYFMYAIGPKGTAAAAVKKMLGGRYGGDDWKWKIEKLSAPTRSGATPRRDARKSGHKAALRNAIRRDR